MSGGGGVGTAFVCKTAGCLRQTSGHLSAAFVPTEPGISGQI